MSKIDPKPTYALPAATMVGTCIAAIGCRAAVIY